MTLANYDKIEKDKLINKNYSKLRSSVLKICDDYRNLENAIDALIKKFGFYTFYFSKSNKYRIKDVGTLSNDLFSTINTLLKVENNNEKRKMLLKSSDIYQTVVEATNNKTIFQIIRYADVQILITDLYFVGLSPTVSLSKDSLKEKLRLIKEHTNEIDIKNTVINLNISLLYGNENSNEQFRLLMTDFILEKKNELTDFKEYITEKMLEIEEMIEEKLKYIGSEEHIKDYLNNNVQDFIFNNAGIFITHLKKTSKGE
jgi:hypothetical protein